MLRISTKITLLFAALSLAFVGAGRAQAQQYPPAVAYYPPAVAYYAPAPIVTRYSPPVVYSRAVGTSYYYAPAVSYYAPPVVTYYTPSPTYYGPAVSYAAPVASVTTTRYGLLGRPRVSTTYYYP
jgi:hypothetical protein